MDSNAGYVLFAYVLACAVLAAYGTWLVLRLRRAERSYDDVGLEEPRATDRSP